MQAPRQTVGFVKTHGFDDIDEDNESTEGTAIDIPLQNQARNRKKSNRKKNRRIRLLEALQNPAIAPSAAENKKTSSSENGVGGEKYMSFYSNILNSRLLQELHKRDSVYGLSSDEAQHLIADKLLFLGDAELRAVRTRRFCLVVTSKETFDLGNGCRIPAEIVTISMEHGRVNSILRLFPSYHRTFEKDPIELYHTHKTQCVYWNPSMMADANQVHECWSRFLEPCLHSFLLVPQHNKQALLDFLRTANEIRTILNNRPTVSICLSRVVAVEDYLFASQHVMGSNIHPGCVPSMDLSLLDHALEYCRFYLKCMNMIFMTATLAENEMKMMAAQQQQQQQQQKKKMAPAPTPKAPPQAPPPQKTLPYPHWIRPSSAPPAMMMMSPMPHVAPTPHPGEHEQQLEEESPSVTVTVPASQEDVTETPILRKTTLKKEGESFEKVMDWLTCMDFDRMIDLDVAEDVNNGEHTD